MIFYRVMMVNCLIAEIIYLNLLKMSRDDRVRKNKSMISTHHMSCNQSNATNFYS